MSSSTVGRIAFGVLGVDLLATPAAVVPELQDHFTPVIDMDSRASATLDVAIVDVPHLPSERPAPDGEAIPVSLLDGVIRGWHSRERRSTSVSVPHWLLRPSSIRGFDQLFVPLFYELTRDPDIAITTVLVHGSAVEVTPGRAALFLAPSEGGKSTIARLAGSRPVLHEECVIVGIDVHGAYVSSGPWFGYRTRRAFAPLPLCGMFLLDKASSDSIEPTDGAEQHARVLRQLVLPRGFAEASRARTLGRLVDFCESLCSVVPPKTLRFRPDPDVWSVVEPALLQPSRRP